MTARRAVAAAVVVAAALALPASATAAVGAKEVGRFNRPVYVHGPEGADGLLFVVERAGRVYYASASSGRVFMLVQEG